MLSFVLYPYVYLLARSAFLEQSDSMLEVARVCGYGPWGTFLRVALPLARPGIVAGTALALMETLADFGTVAVFRRPDVHDRDFPRVVLARRPRGRGAAFGGAAGLRVPRAV